MEFLFECPHVASAAGSPQYVGDPDLIMLREDLADELGAVIGYLECADEIRDRLMNEKFREIAREEAGHFVSLMRAVAGLDPVQAEELKKQELTILAFFGDQVYSMGNPCGCYNKHQGPFVGPKKHYGDEKKFSPEEKKHYSPDFRVYECLRNAIRDEFHAINAYQKQVQSTANPSLQGLLTTIMNKEKQHVAIFTKLLYDLKHE